MKIRVQRGSRNDRVMSVDMLTGRPKEEMPGSTGDLLPELLQLARTSSAGDERRRPGLVAIHLPTRRPWRACREAEGSATSLPIMEDIGLLSRHQGGLGHGEDTVHEG